MYVICVYNQIVAMRPRQVDHGWKTREKSSNMGEQWPIETFFADVQSKTSQVGGTKDKV